MPLIQHIREEQIQSGDLLVLIDTHWCSDGRPDGFLTWWEARVAVAEASHQMQVLSLRFEGSAFFYGDLLGLSSFRRCTGLVQSSVLGPRIVGVLRGEVSAHQERRILRQCFKECEPLLRSIRDASRHSLSEERIS